MKRVWMILVAGLALGAAAYACVFRMGTSAHRSVWNSDEPALRWLQREFQLTDQELERVTALHEAYLPHCQEMCRRIDVQNRRLQQLLASTNTVTPEIEQALAGAGQLRAQCQADMLKHFYAVAQTMPPEQGARYLAWVQSETLLPGHMAHVVTSLPHPTP